MNELYEKIKDLCDLNHITPFKLCKELGLHQNTFSDLKTGRKASLKIEVIQKICDYFGVSMQYFSDSTITSEDALIDSIKDNEDLRALFMLARDCSKDDIKKAIAVIEALKHG